MNRITAEDVRAAMRPDHFNGDGTPLDEVALERAARAANAVADAERKRERKAAKRVDEAGGRASRR